MPRRNGGRNNALKHGAFATDAILAGEKREDYDALYRGLCAEWEPSGPLEEEAVRTLANCLWSKRRVERFYREQMLGAEEDPAEEERFDADRVYRLLKDAKDFEMVHIMFNGLPPRFREALIKDVDVTNFQNSFEAYVNRLRERLAGYMEMDEIVAQENRERLQYKARQAARFQELTAKKIMLDERLNWLIDKSFRRLVQIKVAKDALPVDRTRARVVSDSDRRGE